MVLKGKMLSSVLDMLRCSRPVGSWISESKAWRRGQGCEFRYGDCWYLEGGCCISPNINDPVFGIFGEFHGLYSPWGCKESETTERLSLLENHFAFFCFSSGWFYLLPSVNCYKLPSIVLQACCLQVPTPWIYSLPQLQIHRGFELCHTWLV